jgi:arginyl-tRNA synthetase
VRCPDEAETVPAVDDASPPLTHSLLELAHVFDSFYHKNRVLDSEMAAEERPVLTESTAQVFENGLGLLGIETLAEM